jgi:hypothetical protein
MAATGLSFWFLAAPLLARAQATKTITEPRPAAGKDQDSKAPPRVTLLSLQVARQEPPQADVAPAMMRMHRFNMMNQSVSRPGTTLTLLLEDPDRLIEGIESKDCKITSFRDDKGTDLLKDEAPANEDGVLIPAGVQPLDVPFSAVAQPDGHRVTVTVHSARLPATSSNKILLEANLVLRYMHGEKTIEQKNVNLKLDKITAGPIPLIVASQSFDEAMMGRRPNIQPGTQVIIYHQGPMIGVRKLEFIDADGNEIKATASGSGSNGSIQQTYYQLEGKVETCTVRFTVPDVIEKATVAISLTTGVGFPPGVRRSFVPTPAPHGSTDDEPPR